MVWGMGAPLASEEPRVPADTFAARLVLLRHELRMTVERNAMRLFIGTVLCAVGLAACCPNPAPPPPPPEPTTTTTAPWQIVCTSLDCPNGGRVN